MRRAWLLAAFTIVVALAGVILDLGEQRAAGSHAIVAVEALMLGAIAMVGATVASRVPSNPCGWLVSVIPASFAVTILGTNLHDFVLRKQGVVEGAALTGPWLASWSWIPALLSLALFIQLFPTGRPLPGRWGALLWTAAVAGPLLFVGTAFERGRFADFNELDNPMAANGVMGDAVAALGVVGFVLLIVTLVGAIASLVVRWRRSIGAERQQLKWVATAALSFPPAFAAPTGSGTGEDLGFAALMLAFFLIALAVAVAILRYRLYDLGLVIRRTVTYAALTATLVGAYLLTVLVAQLVLPERSDFGVALSTLAAVVAFAPARRRIQAAVDRRFFRRSYDAQQTLAAFGLRTRDEVDLDSLSDELRELVGATMQPAHVSVWMRPS